MAGFDPSTEARGTRHGFLLGSGRLPDTLRGALWRPGRHVVTDGDDHQPRDFVELLDRSDGGRRIRDDDMEQVGVYVLALLLLPLLRRAPHRVEVGVPPRRAWMTAARRLGQRRLSSRSTRCGGRPRQRAERRRVRQRCRPATVSHYYRRERGGAGTTETGVRLLTTEWRERTGRRRMVVVLRMEIARLEAAHPADPGLGEVWREFCELTAATVDGDQPCARGAGGGGVARSSPDRGGCPSVGDPDLARRGCRGRRAWPITGSGSCRCRLTTATTPSVRMTRCRRSRRRCGSWPCATGYGSPEAAVAAVAQGRRAGVARPARVAGVDRRRDACGGRVPPGGGRGCDGIWSCAPAATRIRRMLSAAAGGGRRCAYGSEAGAMVWRVASKEAGSRCRKAEFWTP